MLGFKLNKNRINVYKLFARTKAGLMRIFKQIQCCFNSFFGSI